MNDLKYKIQTAAEVYNNDQVASASRYTKGCTEVFDMSFKNVGTANAVLLISGSSITLNAGDPMMSLGGYPNCTRRDEIQVQFSGAGTKIVQVFYTLKVTDAI